MKKLFLVIFSILCMSSFLPHTVLAQTSCDDLRKHFETGGGADVVNKLPVYCSEGQVYNKITTTLYILIGMVAVISVVYGGYLYMTSYGNAAQAKKGREVLIYTILGVVVVLLAVLLVNVFVNFLVNNQLF